MGGSTYTKYYKEYYRKNIKKIREKQREYYAKNREKLLEHYKTYFSNPENRAKKIKHDKEYHKKMRMLGLIDYTKQYGLQKLKDSKIFSAYYKTHKMIKTGKIKRNPCEMCGIEKTHAHHDDYNKPLEIRWLCPSCHKKFHLGIV